VPQRFLVQSNVSEQKQTNDHFGKAVGYLLLGVAGGLALDLCAKKLLETYAIEQFVFLRSMFGVLFFLLAARWYGGLGSLRMNSWRWHLVRTLLATGAMFGFFYGLSQMPLVNALTIAFMAPLIVTALSVPFLGEHVGWRRWVAVVTGFLGVLIVLRPGEGMFTPAAMSVILAAFCWSGLALTARKLAATETSFSLSIYVTAGPFLVSAIILPGNYQTPDTEAWVLFILAGLCSAIAWVGIVGGYRRAPPVVLAPFEYTALIGGAIAGYLLWDEVPDRWVMTGGLIIIGSGLYIVYREVGQVTVSRYLRAFSAASPATIFRRMRIRK
jgi:drug/metabolite transporter (DMT)-like permease